MKISGSFVEQHWPLTRIVIGNTLQMFKNRVVGQFQCDQGSYVYKMIHNNSSADDAEVSTYIYDFLLQKQFLHSPSLVHTKSGTRTITVDGMSVLVMEHIPGKTPDTNEANYKQLGEIMGTLNSITDYPKPCPITLQAMRTEFPDVAKKLSSAEDQKKFLGLVSHLKNIDEMPRSLIHFEMSLANTIQKPDGTIIIVDWDEAGMGAKVLDPGLHLITSFVSEEDLTFNKALALAFFTGYQLKQSFSNDEKDAMFDAALFHALRYIVWGDIEKRWRRIQWALKHKDILLSTYQ